MAKINLEEDKFRKDTSASQVMGGTAWLTIANLITIVLGLALVIVSTREISVDVYGSYILLAIMGGLLTQLTTIGLGLTIPRFLAVSTDPDHRESLVNNFLTIRLVVFGAATLIAWVFAPILFKIFGATWHPINFYWVVILFFMNCFTATLQSIAQGFMLFKQIAIWDIASSFLNLLFLWILLALSTNGLVALIISYSLAYFFPGIYLFISIPVRKRLSLKTDLVKEIVKFGFPLQLNDILSYFYGRINTFMVAALLPAADIAYFEIARKIPDSLQSFFDAYTTVFFPMFSRLHGLNEKEKAELLLRNALRLITFISLFIAAIVFLFGKDIIRLLFSDRYIVASPVFFILMVTLTFNLIGFLLGKSLVAVGESDKPAKINLVHGIISLLLGRLLIPPLGIVGAGVTELTGPIATNPLNYFFLNKKFPMRILSAYLKPILIFAVWCGVVYLLPMENFLLRIAALIVFVCLNFLFSVVNKEDVIFIWFELKKVISISIHFFDVHKVEKHENIGD